MAEIIEQREKETKERERAEAEGKAGAELFEEVLKGITLEKLQELYDKDISIDEEKDKKHISPFHCKRDRSMTALMMMCRRGDVDIDYLQVFFQAGSDVNAVSADLGESALMLMCENDKHVTVEKLKCFEEAGADFNIENVYGNTALAILCIRDKSLTEEKLDIFLKAKADFKPKDGSALAVITNLDEEKLRRIRSWGVALLYLCEHQHDLTLGMLRVFQDSNADFNAQNEYSSRTALMALCEKDNNLTPDKLEIFLDERVDFNAMSDDGATPIMLCCARTANVRTEILNVFEKAGVRLPKMIKSKKDKALDPNYHSHDFLEGKRRYWGENFRPKTPPEGCEHLFD